MSDVPKGSEEDVDDLPERYAYLRDVLHKYTVPGQDVDKDQRIGKGLSEAQIKEIADAYSELARRGDVQGLSAWLDGHDRAFWKMWDQWTAHQKEREEAGLDRQPSSEAPRRPRGLKLFTLFRALARKGIQPFASREVEYSPPAQPLHWSKLPAELAFLRQPAMQYGRLQFREDRDRLEREMTPAQRHELESLAARVRTPENQKAIYGWLDTHSTLEHPEASLVYWLMAVLNEFVPEGSDAERPTPLPDWNHLPPELSYLAEPARKFGGYSTPDARLDLMADMVDEQGRIGDISPRFLELMDLSRRVRRPRDRRLLDAWLEKFSPGLHTEAALVMSLLMMLDDYFPDASG